ncbi:MAG: hypothetical protein WA001_05655 [Patescibacteria group bacterium]
MKNLIFAFVISCLSLGCAASTTNSAPAAPSADPCINQPNAEAYTTCAKAHEAPAVVQAPPPAPAQEQVAAQVKAPNLDLSLVDPAAPPPAKPAPQQVTIQQAPRAEMPAPQVLAQVAQVAPPPPPAIFPMGQVVAAPVPVLPNCGIPDSVALVVNNNTDWLIEVRGKVAPLRCEIGDTIIPAKVRRHNGGEETIMVIGPHTVNVRLMFLVPGEVRVDYEAYQAYGAYLPAIAVGHSATRFDAQNTLGGARWQDLRQVGTFKLYAHP